MQRARRTSLAMAWGTCALVSCVLFSAAQSKATPQDTQRVQAGQQVFVKDCLQCHSTYEGQTSFGPNLFHEMSQPGAKKTAKQVRPIIENGKGKMPAFADKLTQTDVENLMAYLKTL